MKALKSQESAYPGVRISAQQLMALSPLMALILAACGGGTSSTEPTALAPVVVAPPAVTPPVVTPPPRVTAFCDSTPKETLGADDPFYVNSWHLKNTGPTQAVSASNNVGLAGIDANTEAVHNGGLGCTGKGIVIAINDSGLELTHEDIAPNLVAGKSFNFNTLSDDPSPAIPQLTTDHGTGVAGVAIARGWNGKGSRGTAPFASVVGYVSATESSPEISYLAYGGRSKAGTSALVTQFGNREIGRAHV